MSRFSLLCVAALALGALVYSFPTISDNDIDATTPLRGLLTSSLQDPVLNQNFPDPAILEIDGVFYAYATNGGGQNIQAARSLNLSEWTVLPDAMPELGPWVQPMRGQVWAPEAIGVAGRYLLYYTARDSASNRQCIGVASSDGPEGPFRDTAERPLICPAGFHRAIDPNPYLDRRRLYIYYSGVCCDRPNGIFVQRLSPDGLATVSGPQVLVEVDASWEGTIAEAPTMLKRDGKYYLFYSGNDYRSQSYAVGYAICESPVGPCAKAQENPVLTTGSSGSRALGPGHQSIVRVGGDHWIVFHGWTGVIGYREGGSRAMWVQPLTWHVEKPSVGVPLN